MSELPPEACWSGECFCPRTLTPGRWPETTWGQPVRLRSVTGVGANVMIGGSNRTVALQPLSVEGQIGVNLALGVTGMELRYVQ